MRARILLPVLLLALSAAAQDAPPEGPRALFDRFFALTKRYAKAGDEEALGEAGRLFDTSGLPKGSRDDLGRKAALDLLNYLNRLEEKVPTETFPVLTDESPFVHRTEFGDIEAVKLEDGTWRFSAQTLEDVSDWFEKVRGRDASLGVGAVRDLRTRIREMLPDWMLDRSFGLANWQWIGLLLFIVLGGLAGAIGRAIAVGIAERAARLRGVTLEKGRAVGRPFTLLAMAFFWLACVGLLDLPVGLHVVLMIAIQLVLMVGAVWCACRIVDWMAEVLQARASRTASRLDDLLVPMFRTAIKVIVVILGMLWIADNLGQDVGTLIAGLGIGGVAIALASKDTVENFFGAFSILLDRPFQVGDWIVMGSVEGTVTDVGFRTTRVRTFYNSLVTFPNAMLIRTAVDNLGAREYRRIKMTLGITYDTPPDKLESFIEGIRELIRIHPYTRKDYYHVYFHGYGESSLDVLLYCFVRAPDWGTELRERHRLMMDILRLANSLGVEFAFPTRTLHMIQAEAPAHGEPEPELTGAWKKGQKAANEILERFTGRRAPPPVRIGQRPDEALREIRGGDAAGEGAGGDGE